MLPVLFLLCAPMPTHASVFACVLFLLTQLQRTNRHKLQLLATVGSLDRDQAVDHEVCTKLTCSQFLAGSQVIRHRAVSSGPPRNRCKQIASFFSLLLPCATISHRKESLTTMQGLSCVYVRHTGRVLALLLRGFFL